MLKYFIILITALVATACTDETTVRRVTITPTELNLQIGETYQLEMIVDPLSATLYNPTAWKSSDTNVATVDSRGNVTAVYSGECIITGQASHVESQCTVIVSTPTYKLDFTQATIFNQGQADSDNANQLVVRLHNDDISIDSTGVASGNGLFLNIVAYAPLSQQHLPEGNYTTATAPATEYSISAGALLEQDGQYYATGSYLGQYTDNGLSVVFINQGIMNVAGTDAYTIECVFDGERNEHIEASYAGVPRYYSTSESHFTTSLYYTSASTTPTLADGETATNHMRVTLRTASDTTVILTARTPISSQSIPAGRYTSSTDVKAFTLCSTDRMQYASIATAADTVGVRSATLDVVYPGSDGQALYFATLTAADNSQYIIAPSGYNSASISKLEIEMTGRGENY